ncbi:DNA-processing protein DprA [Rhodovibrio salinarum]|uniref:DNA-processing protein DprA n=1 Tax=Rhodovibrio salinarum TaxID=1087 RepID=UPI002ADD37FC|nr:DNA-processing protein DprA [Rhodovibrio salinarum]
MSRQETIDWLRLIRSENVGPVTFHALLRRFGTPATALDALPELATRGGRKKPIKICPRTVAEKELNRLEKLGGHALACGHAGYPALLAALDDAPPLLFVRGHPALLDQPAIALVGARNASANGRRMARTLAHELASEGLLVVSGLARGIDGAAHTGALGDGTLAGGTCAAMAGGVDVVYPPDHAQLYDELATRGVLISEMPVGTEPQARHFPRRNRLISGLSLGVVVVEAALKSGSLITARLAGEQGREVFAVPGSPLDPRAKGCNRLLRDGAVLVESTRDVLDGLRPLLRSDPHESPARGYLFGALGWETDMRTEGEMAGSEVTESELARARSEIAELLDPTPVAVDEVIRQCQLSPAIVTLVLLEMELAGRCERHPGNRVARRQDDIADAS